jgi:hypothetical protein
LLRTSQPLEDFVSVDELATLNCVRAVIKLGDLLRRQLDYLVPFLRVAAS